MRRMGGIINGNGVRMQDSLQLDTRDELYEGQPSEYC
jgi:hypothetical protein